ncbi:hypothetical protein SLEP1_g17445 [Rubroshorea leprosula]|uniref:Uncharacterized protein n=1 Tax=Rubroshorea leprosula TaxID=152421 RepID=A0AAV5J371_9ROSI|nr:hypothetical protein SLEP1_g17445 [Rubroshorea leprosula]
MGSRRAGRKRKQVGNSSVGGQAWEEGNIFDSSPFWEKEASQKYEAVKNLSVLPCNNVKFSQFPQGDMNVKAIFSEIGWISFLEIKELVYNDVVHQFYANLKPKKKKCKTMVSGMLVKWNNIDLAPYRLGEIKAGITLNITSFEKLQCELRNGIWRKKQDQEMRGRMDTMDGKLDQLVNHFFPPPPTSAT